jgi:hypothetical protein
VLDKLRRVWPGLAILVGLSGGLVLCAHAVWGGMLEFAPDPGCRGGGCAGSLAERASHDARLFALGALGGSALMIAGVVAAVRRGKRAAVGADGCRSGMADPARADPLASARLRRPGDRVITT